MERYTQMGNGYHVVSARFCSEDPYGDMCGEAIDRLAAYENLGLTPKELRKVLANAPPVERSEEKGAGGNV